MKKVMFILFVNSLLFVSCAKEKNLIKNIAGRWDVYTLNGHPLLFTRFAGIEFEEKNRFLEVSSGTFFQFCGIDVLDEGESICGTYRLTSNDQITLTYPDGSHDILTVNSITDTTMVLTDPKANHTYSFYKN